MTVNFASALAAYGKSAATAGSPGLEARDVAGPSFAKTLGGFLNQAPQSINAAEQQTIASLTGKGDLVDVIQAIQRAEMDLTAVVAIRDRVIGSYQEILRMPI